MLECSCFIFLFFFFQAEDGIRDKLVTGVQTCALPILTYTAGSNGTLTGSSPQTVDYNASGTLVTALPNTGYHFTGWSDGSTAAARTDSNVRSEERRVGKEGRSRWTPDH